MDSRNLETVINSLGQVIYDKELEISCLRYKVEKLEAENKSLREMVIPCTVGGIHNERKES